MYHPGVNSEQEQARSSARSFLRQQSFLKEAARLPHYLYAHSSGGKWEMTGTLSRLAILLFASALIGNAATTIWAGTRNGLYKSVDSGVTWQPVTVTVTNPLLQGTSPQTPNVAAVALDPQQPSVV